MRPRAPAHVHLDRGDEFVETFEVFMKVIESLKQRDADEVERLTQAIAGPKRYTGSCPAEAVGGRAAGALPERPMKLGRVCSVLILRRPGV